MKNIFKLVSSIAILTVCVACGSSKTDRAISGAAIGAGVGAAGAAVMDKNPVAGAAIGAGVGAAAGAVTDEKDVDLGKPIWK
jgi:hypothetical protein